MDKVNSFLKNQKDNTGHVYQWAIMKDGFIVSIQAHSCAYCEPRESNAFPYSKFELGYPSEKEELIMPYMDRLDGDDPLNCVYGYVPLDVVEGVIEKHGGIVGTKLVKG